MRILLTVAYDGTDFCGYQVQPSKRTVEEEINNAIYKITGEKVKSVASGRTDSGVHALGQKVHFDTNSNIPCKSFYKVLNGVLPSDIKVLNSKRVKSDFNARYFAKEKTYVYSIYYGETENPLKSRYKTYVNKALDVEKMKEASKLLVGTHDFKCFLASGSSVKDTVRTIYSIKIIKKGKDVDIKVSGSGFLYNMVRIIAGTLVGVSYGSVSLKDIKTALENGDRKLVGKTMPPQGLCLLSVSYK